MEYTDVAAVLARPISQELLGSSIPARLACTGIDGGPRVVPDGLRWTGSQLIVCTVSRSAKVRALQAHPRVAITIDTEGYPPRVLLVRGGNWAKLLDFETTVAKAVADLIQAYGDPR
ncbi:pyridoxamine 5'-phosphate oxidase family protein [Pseudonocardia sp. GCM10023141]|uniref:pyridoxamine 5'-phosphate oxidase family protein n=1 Tax=Pseudonocardia sp. GCM10023141 TaxID=3252653 RepID=UPI00361F9BF1